MDLNEVIVDFVVLIKIMRLKLQVNLLVIFFSCLEVALKSFFTGIADIDFVFDCWMPKDCDLH